MTRLLPIGVLVVLVGCPSSVVRVLDEPDGAMTDAGHAVERDAGDPRDADAGDSRSDGGGGDGGLQTDGGPTGSHYTLEATTSDIQADWMRCGAREGATTVVAVDVSYNASCEEPGPVEVDMNTTTQVATFTAFVWRRAGEPCLEEPPRTKTQNVVVDGLTAGTWRLVSSSDDQEIYVDGPPPPIVCTVELPVGSTCLVDCDCAGAARCLPAHGDIACDWRCAEPCTLDVGPTECGSGTTCSATGTLSARGPACEPTSTDECGAAAPCPAGMTCSKGDAYNECAWSIGLSAAARRRCSTHADCGPGLDCVETSVGERTCEVRCLTDSTTCPPMHACRIGVGRGPLNPAWVCEWLGD
jgi:hypothetical protein